MDKLELIKLFESHQGQYISGKRLAQMSNISRTAVWKQIKKLRDDGYIIDGITNSGYCLKGTIDVLSENAIRLSLKTQMIGKKIDIKEEITSTNTKLRELAYDGLSEGYVLIADTQTKGRGQRERLFYSPKRNGIYMSILLRPQMRVDEIQLLTQISAISVLKAIEKLYGVDVQIKWVNDILYNGKKLCGILTEAAIQAETAEVDFVVVGIGINTSEVAHFPNELKNISIGLCEITNQPIIRNTLISEILNHFEQYYLSYIETKDKTNIEFEYQKKLMKESV